MERSRCSAFRSNSPRRHAVSAAPPPTLALTPMRCCASSAIRTRRSPGCAARGSCEPNALRYRRPARGVHHFLLAYSGDRVRVGQRDADGGSDRCRAGSGHSRAAEPRPNRLPAAAQLDPAVAGVASGPARRGDETRHLSVRKHLVGCRSSSRSWNSRSRQTSCRCSPATSCSVNPAGDPVFGADIMSNAGLSSLVTGVTSLEDPAVATQNRTQVIRAIQDNITQFLDQLVAFARQPRGRHASPALSARKSGHAVMAPLLRGLPIVC